MSDTTPDGVHETTLDYLLDFRERILRESHERFKAIENSKTRLEQRNTELLHSGIQLEEENTRLRQQLSELQKNRKTNPDHSPVSNRDDSRDATVTTDDGPYQKKVDHMGKTVLASPVLFEAMSGLAADALVQLSQQEDAETVAVIQKQIEARKQREAREERYRKRNRVKEMHHKDGLETTVTPDYHPLRPGQSRRKLTL